MSCREFLLKYWMKPSRDVSQSDANSVRDLYTHFKDTPVTNATVGERLKRVNALLQVHWMLEDASQLEKDFREYISLLSANALDRMILFGGQNVIETTIRWGQLRAGDRLLPLWLDAVVVRNDPNVLLDFASANLTASRFWTTAKLMDRIMSSSPLSKDRRFVAQACHAIALSGISRMAADPDHTVHKELDIAQVRWALAGSSEERLVAQFNASLDMARHAYAAITEPSREHRSLKRRLDITDKSTPGNERPENEPVDSHSTRQIP
jgi:hypothetical protein